MDRINHVKIVTPDPVAVDRFLREVVDFPAGWPLAGDGGDDGDSGGDPVAAGPPADPRAPARDAEGRFTAESVGAFRGASSFNGGFITGSPESRQFQILQGDVPRIWATAIGTRDLEGAHRRCTEQGIACTELATLAWGDGQIGYFFAEVGGIVFEIMRAEPRS